MKYKNLFLIGTIMASLFISLSFGVGKAHATTGCFTDTIGHPFETFICWMLDNGITSGTSPGIYSPNANVTRGQMAVFMQRQAEIPPSTGDIYINSGLNNWLPNSAFPGAYISYYSDVTQLHTSGAAGTYGFQITADLPATLYGRQMKLSSVKLCYNATHGATLTWVYFRHYTGGAVPFIYNELVDSTDHIDASCNTYAFPSAGALWGSDHAGLFIVGDYASAADYINVSAVTFVLTPTSTAGTLSPLPEAIEQRSKMQAPQPATGEAGAAP